MPLGTRRRGDAASGKHGSSSDALGSTRPPLLQLLPESLPARCAPALPLLAAAQVTAACPAAPMDTLLSVTGKLCLVGQIPSARWETLGVPIRRVAPGPISDGSQATKNSHAYVDRPQCTAGRARQKDTQGGVLKEGKYSDLHRGTKCRQQDFGPETPTVSSASSASSLLSSWSRARLWTV